MTGGEPTKGGRACAPGPASPKYRDFLYLGREFRAVKPKPNNQKPWIIYAYREAASCNPVFIFMPTRITYADNATDIPLALAANSCATERRLRSSTACSEALAQVVFRRALDSTERQTVSIAAALRELPTYDASAGHRSNRGSPHPSSPGRCRVVLRPDQSRIRVQALPRRPAASRRNQGRPLTLEGRGEVQNPDRPCSHTGAPATHVTSRVSQIFFLGQSSCAN